METLIKLFSTKEGEIFRFLKNFYNTNNEFENVKNSDLEWTIKYENPVEMADLIGIYIENFQDYKLTMWVSLDKDVLINITDKNADDVIRYLYERFPY